MSRFSSILSITSSVEPTGSSIPSEQETDDLRLFARFLDGDDKAFMELFNRHTPRLYLYCRKFINNRQQANDIMQDMWERVIRFRSEGKPLPRSPLGLFVRTLRNLSLNHLRNEQRKRLTSLDDMEEWQIPAGSSQELTEMEEAVIIALQRLPISQREVLILNAYSGYRFEEIAGMLEEPVGAVRTRAWRARLRLGRIISALLGLNQSNENNDDDNDIRTEEEL